MADFGSSSGSCSPGCVTVLDVSTLVLPSLPFNEPRSCEPSPLESVGEVCGTTGGRKGVSDVAR